MTDAVQYKEEHKNDRLNVGEAVLAFAAGYTGYRLSKAAIEPIVKDNGPVMKVGAKVIELASGIGVFSFTAKQLHKITMAINFARKTQDEDPNAEVIDEIDLNQGGTD